MSQIETGSVALVFEEKRDDYLLKVEFVGWKGKNSLRAYVPKGERIHYLRLLGCDTSKYEKNKFEERRAKGWKRNGDSEREEAQKEAENSEKKDGDESNNQTQDEKGTVKAEDAKNESMDTTEQTENLIHKEAQKEAEKNGDESNNQTQDEKETVQVEDAKNEPMDTEQVENLVQNTDNADKDT